MAKLLGCALQSVARWETSSEPKSATLWRLWTISRDHQYDDLAEVFRVACEKFKQTDRRKAEEIEKGMALMREIMGEIVDLMEIGIKLHLEKHPAGRRIQEIALHIGEGVSVASWWPWRK
jgi:hypothetical protein